MSIKFAERDAAYFDNEKVRNLSPEQRAIYNEVLLCREQIEKILCSKPAILGKGFWGVEGDVPAAAYFLTKACEYNNPISVPFSAFAENGEDPDVLQLAENNHIPEHWKELRELTLSHKQNIFQLVALMNRKEDPMVTPDSVSTLAKELLNVRSGDRFCDLCCGSGTVALNIKEDVPKASVMGYDINRDAVAMAKIYNKLKNSDVNFSSADVFDILSSGEPEQRFNKLFANYPFGMRLQNLGAGRDYLARLQTRIPSISKATSSDWLFNLLMVEMLENDGKAIGVMTNGSTWNMIDAPIRKYFVESGFVECVITLPARMFNSISISTSMIVLSKGNSAGVHLVDATAQCTIGRRINELSDDNIRAIINATKADGEFSAFVSLEELRENDYVLSHQRYNHSAQSVENGEEFGSIIKRITRGAPLNAKALDEIASSVPTEMQYLMISNIRDGLIDIDLPYLSKIDSRNEKYCLTNHCLILSKNGYPYKVAVAEIPDGKQIMANGNLYIIEIDEEKADPYYLAAYLSSEQGFVALKNITVGATIPNIGVDQLKKLIIPVPALEEQKRIGEQYRAVKDEIVMLQHKLERARNRMAHIFEEGGK